MSLKSRTLLRFAIRVYQGSAPRNYHNVNISSYSRHPNLNSSYAPFNICRRLNEKKALKCWQCGIERQNIMELFCEKCKFIQNPQEKYNYFKVFDLDESFDIDRKQLTKKYRKMQSVLHPDKFSNKSDQEKSISEEFSALVNKAYDTLQLPLKRAIHLLTLKGEMLAENQTADDPEFLMEIMELNEEVESADTADKLIDLNKKNKVELEKIGNDIKASFASNNLEEAKKHIIKMKYYNSVSSHINGLMREKGIVE